MAAAVDNSTEIQHINSRVKIVYEAVPQYYSFALGLFINRGSRDEAEKENGITHLIEHMLFKGTAQKSALEIVRMIEGLGGSFDAFTTKENIVIVTRFLSEHFVDVFKLIGEILLESRFGEEEFSKEKSVIVEEIKSNDEDPSEHVFDLLFEVVFDRHSMALPIAGTVESVSALNLNNVQRYYQDLLKSQIVISVSGNFNLDELVESAHSHFKDESSFITERIPPNVFKPKSIYQKRNDISQVHLAVGLPAVAYSSDFRYPLLLFSTMLGGGMSSRLFQGLREEKGLVYDVHSFFDFYSDCGIAGFYLTADKNNLRNIVEQLKLIFDGLRKKGFNEEELSIAKTYVTGNFLLSLESSTNRMLRIGREVSYLNKTVPVSETVRKITEVDLKVLNEFAKNYFDLSRYSIAAIGPIEDDFFGEFTEELKR